MGHTFYFEWEVQLMVWLQSVLGSAADIVGSFFTLFGEELLLVAFLGFLYWCLDKELGKRVGLMVIIGIVWNPFVKNIFLRRRPYFDATRRASAAVAESGQAGPEAIMSSGSPSTSLRTMEKIRSKS